MLIIAFYTIIRATIRVLQNSRVYEYKFHRYATEKIFQVLIIMDDDYDEDKGWEGDAGDGDVSSVVTIFFGYF